MKDEAFDQLFKDSLKDAEVQPSANLWNSIAEELKPHKKKVFPGYWVAAAVILIVMAAVLVSPEEEKIRLQAASSPISDQVLPSSETHAALPQRSKGREAGIDTYESTPLVIAPRLKEVNTREELTVKQPAIVTIHPVVRQPDSLSIAKRSSVDATVIEDLVIAKVDVTDEIADQTIAESDVASKGINNVGDFVNYVVSKVDKREHKFLKFNTDDDNSSLVGINIGFIKLNLKRSK